MPHRRGTGERVFVPVAELAEAFAEDVESKARLADLELAGDVFDDDRRTDPFDSPQG